MTFSTLRQKTLFKLYFPDIRRIEKDPLLTVFFTESINSFRQLEDKEVKNWIITFSGGKDSTLTSILAIEYLKRFAPDVHIDVVYSDTLIEIPPVRDVALHTLEQIENIAKKEGLNVETHHLAPEMKDRFWVNMLGKGYPPPRPRFRWCTHRLKINPTLPLIQKREPAIILTGVRYGESSKRTGQLRASCSRDSECGQSFWFIKGPKRRGNIYYAAPIINWKTCRVWDFLGIYAIELGWDTSKLLELYCVEEIRFGCWMCTLVKEDKAMKALIEHNNDYDYLEKLMEFRNFIDRESRREENRLLRTDGRLGGLTLKFRKHLYRKLLYLQDDINLRLIEASEREYIQNVWGDYDESKGSIT